MTLPDHLQTGALEIDFPAYRILRNGDPVRLTRTEWAMLRELVNHRNQVLTHEVLLRRVWGEAYGNESDYVHTYISRLRRKLEADSSQPVHILTEAGTGYVFRLDDADKKQSVPDNHESTTQSPEKQTITINPLPQFVESRYTGREQEQATLRDLLIQQTPLISIYGRAGAGKTALACHVLTQFLQPSPPLQFDGMVFLSANGTGISMGRIFADFARLLHIAEENQARTPIAQRISRLLEHLAGGDYVLLLDNLESLQDSQTGALSDDELDRFLQMALAQPGHLRIVITGREILALPHTLRSRERRIALDSGLTVADSIMLLRRIDADNAAGLRDASDDVLAQITERCAGYPRALEAVVGLLLEDPFLTPADILNDTLPVDEEISAVLVKEALKRLDSDSLRLMQIIAAFQQPMTMDALQALSQHYLPDDFELRPALNRLIQRYFLRLNQADKSMTLHPVDSDYCYSLIPEDTPDSTDDFNRKALHRHIAAYYHAAESSRASSALSEFEHLRLSGQIDDAARHLLIHDEALLSGEGYHSELAEKYARILPDIHDETLQHQIRLRLGEAYRATGQLWQALDCFEVVYKHGTDADHHHALSGMARAHYDLGQFQSALTYWQQALDKTIADEDTESEAHVRSGIGWVSYLLGDYDAAIRDFREALRLFRLHADRRHEGMNLGDMGVVLMALGDMEGAIQLLEQSLDIADLDGSEREAGYKGMYLATAHLLAGQWDAADEVTRITLQYRGAPINKPALLTIHGMILMHLNLADDARHAFQMAVQEGETLLNLTPGLYQLRYARGLAYAGLALLNHNPPIDAELELGRAQAICSAKGVLASQARLLNVLKQHDTEGILTEIEL